MDYLTSTLDEVISSFKLNYDEDLSRLICGNDENSSSYLSKVKPLFLEIGSPDKSADYRKIRDKNFFVMYIRQTKFEENSWKSIPLVFQKLCYF